jgi:hypothetical protein
MAWAMAVGRVAVSVSYTLFGLVVWQGRDGGVSYHSQ